MEDSEKLAFWGISLKPGEPAELELEDGETLHVSMASFGVELADKHGRSVVTAAIKNSGDEDKPEKKYALSALTAGKSETVCMDVTFIGEEKVTFGVSGKNIVHLVGNFSFENDVDSDSDEEDEGSNLIGVYDDDNDMSDGEDEEEIPRLIMDKDPPVITELPDDDEHDTKHRKALIVKKKASSSSKVENGKHHEPSSKKEAKGRAVKPSAESVKKDKKKLKVDEPLIDDEVEEEEESEDESEDESDEEDGNAEAKPGKHEKKAISDSDDEDDSMESEEDPEEESEDESESEDEEDRLQAMELARMEKIAKKAKTGKGKPSVVFKEAPSQNTKEEEKTTPKSGKSKRHRKRGVVVETPDGVTPPQNKKSKISERPGTPAASKSTGKGKSGGPASQSRPGGKGAKPSPEGSSSGKKGASVPNGVASSPTSTAPARDNPSSPGTGTAGKRKRRRARKSR